MVQFAFATDHRRGSRNHRGDVDVSRTCGPWARWTCMELCEPGSHRHVSVTGLGQFSDLVVPSEVKKRSGATAAYIRSISRRILSLRPESAKPRVRAVFSLRANLSRRYPANFARPDQPDQTAMSSRLDQEPGFGSPQNLANLHVKKESPPTQRRRLTLRVCLWQESLGAHLFVLWLQ